jgi:hypothetical protein
MLRMIRYLDTLKFPLFGLVVLFAHRRHGTPAHS